MPVVEFASKPLPVHVPFHMSAAEERFLAGAVGSGKSYAVCDEAIAWCLEQPGIRGMITRKTIPALRDTTEAVFFDRLPHELFQAGQVSRQGGHVAKFTFPNGSEVLFKSMSEGWRVHKSLNLGFIAWDEGDENTEEDYLGMMTRLRQRDLTAAARARGYTGEITRRGSWMAFNPEGHNWIYKMAIDQSSPTYRKGSEWFKSTSFDNPYLPLSYMDALLAMPEPWIKRYVLCNFDDFAGQIYEDWNWDDHVVEPFHLKYPDKAQFWHLMDPGTRNPTACLWVVMDPATRTLTGIAEYEEVGVAAPKHAAAWRVIEAEKQMKVNWRAADPNIETRDRGSNMKLSDQYRRLGYQFSLGPREHKVRIPALGALITQGRFKVTKECPRTYEAIREYRWEDLTPAQRSKGADPREQPLKKNDHLVDCAQYAASRWIKAPSGLEVPTTYEDPREQFAAEAKQAIRKQLLKRRQMSSQPRHDLGGLRV